MHNLQILVISLEQSDARKKNCSNELSKISFDWNFLKAVDGKKLNYPIPEYDENKVTRLLGFPLTPNEIGCFLSHRKAWQSCVDRNIPTLVFEDDFVILPNFVEVVNQLLKDQQSWGLIRLQALVECSDVVVKDYKEFKLVCNDCDPLGATAYLLSPSTAALLIKNSCQIFEPLDHYLEHHQKHSVKMLAIKPYPIGNWLVDTTISDRPTNRQPIKGIKKGLRSIHRQIDRIFSNEPWFPR
jgi:glycosyl transferase family 25